MFEPRYQKAKKAHKCGSCGADILPGFIYPRIAGSMDGDFWSEKLCHDCDHDRLWLAARGHCWMIGIITDDYDQCRAELTSAEG